MFLWDIDMQWGIASNTKHVQSVLTLLCTLLLLDGIVLSITQQSLFTFMKNISEYNLKTLKRWILSNSHYNTCNVKYIHSISETP